MLSTMIEPRKVIHLSGAVFALIALFAPLFAAACVVLGLVTFISLEIARSRMNIGPLSVLYRDYEASGCASEPLMYLLSILVLLTISLFAMPSVCYASIIVLTIGDGIASVIGKKFGRTRLPYSNKTWAGSISGFLLSTAIGYFFAGPIIIAGAAAGMAVEAYMEKHENALIAASAFISMAFFTVAGTY